MTDENPSPEPTATYEVYDCHQVGILCQILKDIRGDLILSPDHLGEAITRLGTSARIDVESVESFAVLGSGEGNPIRFMDYGKGATPTDALLDALNNVVSVLRGIEEDTESP